MFIGHLALGLAAKRAAPSVSLAVLMSAAQLADLIWPVLLALGLESVRIDPGNTAFTPLDFVGYPWSHSLAMLIVWGAVFGLAYCGLAGQGVRVFLVLALLVISHWVLDWITHRPDMPLYPDGPKLGLGLWNSVAGTMTVELLMFGAGVWLYVQTTRAQDRVGRWAFVGLMAFLLVAYGANAAGGAPPSVSVIWKAAIAAALLLIAWSWWADQHRRPRAAQDVRKLGLKI